MTYNTYGHLFPALEEALTVSLDRSYQEAKLKPPGRSLGVMGEMMPIRLDGPYAKRGDPDGRRPGHSPRRDTVREA